MAGYYTDIGHDEERAELWVWTPDMPDLRRASSIYSYRDGYYTHGDTDWRDVFHSNIYVQGRASHEAKKVSFVGEINEGLNAYSPRFVKAMQRCVDLVQRAWPGYEVVFYGREQKIQDELLAA